MRNILVSCEVISEEGRSFQVEIVDIFGKIHRFWVDKSVAMALKPILEDFDDGK